MLVHAPAKLNLGLYLGRPRADGLHELCSLFEPLALADLVRIEEAERDEVICPGVEGENLAARALAALRERGWEAPPLRIEIEKRTPVAAGLGGGSADAAAVLRLAAGPAGGAGHGATALATGVGRLPRLSADALAGLPALAAELGADVPSQLRPALALVRGAGESLPPPAEHAALLLPGGGGLATKAVFDEADRLGLGRDPAELEEIASRLCAAAGAGASPLAYVELLVNDLESAARSLRPDIGDALDALRRTGAPAVFLSGSGPTAVGLFATLAAAEAAAATLDRADAIVCLAGRAPADPASDLSGSYDPERSDAGGAPR
jgi:4-diphosphocytidyl-2-C-methyl-D-erythritol kinase